MTTILATHRPPGPPSADAQLALYFSRPGLCAAALDPGAVGGGGRSLSDTRLVNSGAAAFPHEHETGAKDRARRASSVAVWEATHRLMELVPSEHHRVLLLVYDPTHPAKPMLRLLDDAPARVRLGPFRMLLDESPTMLAAYAEARRAAHERAQTRTPEATLLRRARATGIQEDGLHAVRRELAEADVGADDIDIALTAEQRALRRRERGLERQVEALVVATRQAAPEQGLHSFILALTGTRKGEKALLSEARAEAEALCSVAWEAWLDVRGRRASPSPAGAAAYERAPRVWEAEEKSNGE